MIKNTQHVYGHAEISVKFKNGLNRIIDTIVIVPYQELISLISYLPLHSKNTEYFPVGTMDATPFNITIIQVYAPTSGHDDSEVDHFYQQLQETIDQTPKKDILVVQGDWNAKVGKNAQADWGEVFGPYCNVETNEREVSDF